MPNWVSNVMHVVGRPDNIEKFKLALREKDGGDNVFDFNRFIKMPSQLENTAAPSLTEQIEFAKKSGVDPTKNMTELEVEAQLDKDAELREKFGADNWYTWRLKNWGTKWNSCDAEIVEEIVQSNGIVNLTYHFSTPWSTPNGIIDALAPMAKAMRLTIDIYSEEEGMYFDCVTRITPNSYEKNIGQPFYYLEGDDGNLYQIDGLEDDEIKELGLDPDDVTASQRGFVCDNTGDLFIDFERTDKKVVYAKEKS